MNPPVILLVFALTASVMHGFTLDAAGYQGNEVTANPRSIFVVGYGEILLSDANDVSVVLSSSYRADFNSDNPPLVAANNSVVPVLFADESPTQPNVVSSEIDQPISSSEPNAFSIIPEPTAAGIGLVAGLLWLLKRRKQNA